MKSYHDICEIQTASNRIISEILENKEYPCPYCSSALKIVNFPTSISVTCPGCVFYMSENAEAWPVSNDYDPTPEYMSNIEIRKQNICRKFKTLLLGSKIAKNDPEGLVDLSL